MTNTKSDYLDLGDGTLYYETAGRGETLVLGHAAFLDSGMFDGVWDALAQRFHVIRYDMRGFGQSSAAAGPIARRDELRALLNHLGVARAHLVGCSLSGEVMLDVALEQPDLPLSLTLVGAVPGGFEMQGEPPRYLMDMFGAMQAGDVDRANDLQIRIWLDGMFREPGDVDADLRAKALAMNRIPVERSTFFVADAQPVRPLDPPAVTRLDTVACPVLAVVGTLDHPEILRAADVMVGAIPDARKVIIEDAAHVPSFEQPETFTALLLDFLRQRQTVS